MLPEAVEYLFDAKKYFREYKSIGLAPTDPEWTSKYRFTYENPEQWSYPVVVDVIWLALNIFVFGYFAWIEEGRIIKTNITGCKFHVLFIWFFVLRLLQLAAIGTREYEIRYRNKKPHNLKWGNVAFRLLQFAVFILCIVSTKMRFSKKGRVCSAPMISCSQGSSCEDYWLISGE